MRAHSAAFVSLLVLALLAPATAQTGTGNIAPIERITDPANDQEVTSSLPEGAPGRPTYASTDITTVSVGESAGNVLFVVKTSAAITDATNIVLHFGVEEGPLSLEGSTADGADFTVSAQGGVVTGVDNATVTSSAGETTITIPKIRLGAVGGDLIVDLAVDASEHDDGATQFPVDDSEGSDRAPDTDAAEPYMVDRIPPNAAISFVALGGILYDLNRTQIGTFSGAAATLTDPNGDVAYKLRITNDGTDSEDVNVTRATGLPQGVSSLDPSPQKATLLPGQSVNVTLELRFVAASGTVTAQVAAAGNRGSSATLPLTITIDAGTITTGSDGRQVTPAGLKFLTPAAEAVGFDGPFKDYAELAFLLACVLLLVILLFLLLFLRGGAWIKVRVSPKHAVVVPGGVARFEVAMSAKGGDRVARTLLQGAWPAGLQFGGQRATSEQASDLSVAKSGTSGVLEVHVPGTVEPKARQTIEIDATPIVDGETVTKRRGHAKVTVQAGLVSHGEGADLEVHLTGIQHEPARPVPGSTVTTTATIQNDGASAAHMRVVLMLDGKAVREESIEIPPSGSRQVHLPWTATSGPTRVKVQAFLA